MNQKIHKTQSSTALAAILWLLAGSSYAVDMCYNTSTHNFEPCGSPSPVTTSIVEDTVRDVTQTVTQTVVENIANTIQETQNTTPPVATPPTQAVAAPSPPTTDTLDSFFTNISYFTSLPFDSPVVKQNCPSCTTEDDWSRLKQELETAARIWNTGMNSQEVSRVQDRMQSIRSDNRGESYWIQWSMPGLGWNAERFIRNLGIGGRIEESFNQRVQQQFEAAGGRYPWR